MFPSMRAGPHGQWLLFGPVTTMPLAPGNAWIGWSKVSTTSEGRAASTEPARGKLSTKWACADAGADVNSVEVKKESARIVAANAAARRCDPRIEAFDIAST
ncbi:hypothetical protein GCM10027448_33390 [Nocardioides dilutus]